jgi:two-component system, OmpR family, response regulator
MKAEKNLEEYAVFLVDDDPVFLDMLRETLADEPEFLVSIFETGEDCLASLHKKPEIIVLDYLLNSKIENARDGMDILKELNRIMPETKVIILSGQEDGSLVYDFTRQNAADYIIKDENAFNNIKQAIHEIILEKKSL